MSKTRRRAKRYFGYAAVVLIFVLLFSVALLLLSQWEKQQGFFPSHDTETSGADSGRVDVFKYKDAEYVLKDGIETFLVLGLDKFEQTADEGDFSNDQQADLIMLFVVDNTSGSYSAIQINRDTMTDINILGIAGDKVGTVNKQISLAHTYGNGRDISCRNTADAVSALTLGMEIDHYVSLTMDTVATLNDLVGGVTVTVLDDFSGVDDTLIKDETITLIGEQALTYIRARRGMEDQSNESRMVRQRQYMEALFEKTMQCIEDDSTFIANAALEMGDQLISDCTLSQLEELLGKISHYEFGEICTMEGTYVKGEEYMEFYHDGNALADTVVKLFYEPLSDAE